MLEQRKWYPCTEEKMARAAFQRGLPIRAKSCLREDSVWKIYATEAEMHDLKQQTR